MGQFSEIKIEGKNIVTLSLLNTYKGQQHRINALLRHNKDFYQTIANI